MGLVVGFWGLFGAGLGCAPCGPLAVLLGFLQYLVFLKSGSEWSEWVLKKERFAST